MTERVNPSTANFVCKFDFVVIDPAFVGQLFSPLVGQGLGLPPAGEISAEKLGESGAQSLNGGAIRHEPPIDHATWQQDKAAAIMRILLGD
jgi:hypothetical protein